MHAERLNLAFSTAEPTLELEPHQISIEPDLLTDDDPTRARLMQLVEEVELVQLQLAQQLV